MGQKSMFALGIGWGMLTILAIAVAATRIIKHNAYQISFIIAILMCILTVYLLILRKVDGPSFTNALNDERLHQISIKGQRNSFWFLFISIWCLAAMLELFNPPILKEYISLVLAALGTIGLGIYMFSFIWNKYRV